MSIRIKGNYLRNLRQANPQEIYIKHKNPVYAALGYKTSHYIPPINTDIRFSSVLPAFRRVKHRGLDDISPSILPEVFDWGHSYPTDTPEITQKKTNISKPGNQALCGSCWAISTAGIVADNFVVSGLVDHPPDLSTTWCLAKYPQGQCNGGNPAQLFQDISQGGIATKHCIDYSWCLKNDACNGSATKHFEAVNLNSLIPDPGCYYGNDHYLYYIDPDSKTIFIGSPGVNQNNLAVLVKKQIFLKGPVLGGFLVFKNFMAGSFANSNQGVYLERGVYDNGGDPTFSDEQTYSDKYVGSHAVAIIGWGIAKNILVDNGGKRADVPYWYCRNSWLDTWADGGYFKMAMYPWNKISQFDFQVVINDQSGISHLGGGIVFVSVSKPPQKQNINNVSPTFTNMPKIENKTFYENEPVIKPSSYPPSPSPSPSPSPLANIAKNSTNYFIGFSILLVIIVIIIMLLK